MRFAHTNLVARDPHRLAAFYEAVFHCVPIPPARDLSGPWLERATGVTGAHIRGLHLRLPGHGPDGPTLEVFTWGELALGPEPAANRPGLAHLAFSVEDVQEAAAAVVAHGGRVDHAVVTHPIPGVGRLTFTYARDPEGNILELQRWEPAPRAGAREAYDRWAADYDTAPNRTRDADAVVLARLLPDLAGQRVLELGCGTGRNTARLLGAREVVGLDISEGMLAVARERVRAPHVRFLQHDLALALPLPDASFDRVVIDLVLEHLDLAGPLSEVARVLVPGGEATIVELHPFRQLVGSRARLPDGTEVDARVHPVTEWMEATRRAGLEVIELQEWDEQGEPAGARWPRLLSLRLRSAAPGLGRTDR